MLLSIIGFLQIVLGIGWTVVWYRLVLACAGVPIIGLIWWFPTHSSHGLRPGTWLYLLMHPLRTAAMFLMFSSVWMLTLLLVLGGIVHLLDVLYYQALCPVFVETRCECLRAYDRVYSPGSRTVRLDCP